MQHWRLGEIDTPDGTRSPVVLHSRDGEGRVVLIALDAGQELGEHQVKEGALLLVVDGSATVDAGEHSVTAAAGDLFHFEPGERHTIRSADGARIVLFLAPWPGVGHYRGGDAAAVSAS